MQLTQEMLAGFVGGQAEIQNVDEEYLYRGEIAEISIENDTLKIKFSWCAKGEGFPPIPMRWINDEGRDYAASLDIYAVSDVGPSGCVGGSNRLCLNSAIVGETVVLYPPNGSRLDPARVEGLAIIEEVDSLEGKPFVAIVWDPELLTADEYAELVTGLGDLVRACGGAGVKLLKSRVTGFTLVTSTEWLNRAKCSSVTSTALLVPSEGVVERLPLLQFLDIRKDRSDAVFSLAPGRKRRPEGYCFRRTISITGILTSPSSSKSSLPVNSNPCFW